MNLNISYNWLKSYVKISTKRTTFIVLIFFSLILAGCVNNINNQNDLKSNAIIEGQNTNTDIEGVEEKDTKINVLDKEQERLQLILDQKKQELGKLERDISIAQHERSATGYTGNVEERQIEIDKLNIEIKDLENKITTQQ